jgi:hypothetical protein
VSDSRRYEVTVGIRAAAEETATYDRYQIVSQCRL